MIPLAVEPTVLQVVWFVLIAVLWLGYLVLEGFDYGVAMLIPFLGRNDKERRVIVNTIGPLWDGNEVWLLTAGGATFAAFPGWYASLFSGLYLPLFLVLLGLIVRGVAFEYRAKRPGTAWRNAFDWCASIGSFVTALVLGVAFANFVIGLRVNSDHTYVGGLLNLFSPFGLRGGVVLVVLFLYHGATFLSLKTKGELHDRANAFAQKAGLVAIVGGAGFLLWSNLSYGTGPLGWVLMVLAAAALVGGFLALRSRRDGWSFAGTAAAIAFVTVGIFVRMYPNLGFDNTLTPSRPLDLTTASSTPLTLQIMTVAAAIFVPIVLGYQGWSYWVFRKRLSTANIPHDAPEPTPVG